MTETRKTLIGSDLPIVAGSNIVLTTDSFGYLNIAVTGEGPGTITSLTPGVGITLTPDPITSTGSVALTTPVSTANGGTGTALLSTGSATFLSAASVDVADATITASSIVMVTEAGSSPAGDSYSVVVNATVGFTIYSSDATSAKTVHYFRVK